MNPVRLAFAKILSITSFAVFVVCPLFAQTKTTSLPSTNAVDAAPFTEAVRHAWTQSGNEVGWLGSDRYGRLTFRASRADASDLPAIRVTSWLGAVSGQ